MRVTGGRESERYGERDDDEWLREYKEFERANIM